MKRIVLVIVLLLIGIGVLAYPSISSYLASKNGSYIADQYKEKIAKTDKKTTAEEWKKAKEYNENMTGAPAHDPFIGGSGYAMPDNYFKVLNVDGVMATIEIPKINVNLPVKHGTSDEVLKDSIGHLEGSALPIGGSGTHAVLTGHTGLTSARLFTDLVDLKKGDQFYINVLDTTLAYQIDQIKVVKPEQTELLQAVKEQDYVTLLTCTPYGVNSHRLLVRGTRIPYKPKEKQKNKNLPVQSSANHAVMIAGLITSIVMLLLILLTRIYNKRKNAFKRQKEVRNKKEHNNQKKKIKQKRPIKKLKK